MLVDLQVAASTEEVAVLDYVVGLLVFQSHFFAELLELECPHCFVEVRKCIEVVSPPVLLVSCLPEGQGLRDLLHLDLYEVLTEKPGSSAVGLGLLYPLHRRRPLLLHCQWALTYRVSLACVYNGWVLRLGRLRRIAGLLICWRLAGSVPSQGSSLRRRLTAGEVPGRLWV